MMSVIAYVSFARTPLEEIGRKVEEIKALGWAERDGRRGDPWVASFEKAMSDAESAEAELRSVMGDYWLTPDDMQELLEQAADSA
jgi:hypothetical protein